MTDKPEEARERVRRAHSHLDAIWARRLTYSEEARKAVNELNDAAKALFYLISWADRREN